MPLETAPHHHVLDGISIAHHGELPEGFVAPTAAAFASKDAEAYGWQWLGDRYFISGRPASNMPNTRKATVVPFGDVDIEGDQVYGPHWYPNIQDENGDNRKAKLETRDALFSLLADTATFDLVNGYEHGFFGQRYREYPVPHTALALVPAKLVKRGKAYMYASKNYYDVYRYEPAKSFNEAALTFGTKWRRYGIAVLRQAGFTNDGPRTV